MEMLHNAANLALEVAFSIGWRAWLVYVLYRCEGESGLVKALALMIFAIVMAKEVYGYSLPLGGDKLISLVNWYVGCAVWVVGWPGWGWFLALFGIGYSSEVKGGFIKRMIHGEEKGNKY